MCTDLLQVHFLTSPTGPLLKRLKTQQTDQQYSYYDKNVKGCLSCEIVCLSMIHLWVYELVPHMETIFQRVNWQTIVDVIYK